MNWLHGAWAVFEKDLKLELRSRYAINTLLMFVLSSLLLVLFAIGQESGKRAGAIGAFVGGDFVLGFGRARAGVYRGRRARDGAFASAQHAPQHGLRGQAAL